MTQQVNTNNVQQQSMIEQVFENYVWRKFESVCTGRPEFNMYFPEKEVDGETWPAVFETSLAVNDEDGPIWYRIRVYDELAKLFNSHLKEGNKVARINAQGYVRTRTYTNRQGIEQTVNYTVIPNKSDSYGYMYLKVRSTWQHMRDTSGSEDPFAEASDSAQVTNREAEHTQAAARAQGDDMQGLASEQSEEASPQTFGLPISVSGMDDAPF